jgi:hypothetical protein
VNSATWGFVGVVVGGGMSVGAEWLRLKSGAQISKEQKKHEIRVGRDTFQKDNLLNLQGDLARWIKAANSAFVLEIGWIRRSQAFSPLPPEVTLDIFETTQLLAVRVERITDDKLRSLLFDLMRDEREFDLRRSMPSPPEDPLIAISRMSAFADKHLSAVDALGKTLRNYL